MTRSLADRRHLVVMRDSVLGQPQTPCRLMDISHYDNISIITVCALCKTKISNPRYIRVTKVKFRIIHVR